MKVAYADPPYLGCCARYDHFHPDGRCWDDVETHRLLIERLSVEFPDGWAMSASSPSLRSLLPLCPEDCRVSPWTKTFAAFKPNVNPAYAWEPVIWRGGRGKRSRAEMTVRDWYSGPITLKKGLCGAKSEGFVLWLFDLLGVQENDEVTDIYPGTGVVGRTLDRWRLYRGTLESASLLDAVDPVSRVTTG
jgi:hypothetical protein